MDAFKSALDRLFGDDRVGRCEAAISAGATQSFGWPGWSMPKWNFTVAGAKQSTSNVVTLIGSFLNPPVSIVGAPTGKYHSARKYAYWATLILLAVALAYGAYKIVFRKKGDASPPNPLEINLELDGDLVNWPQTISGAHDQFNDRIKNLQIPKTVAVYKTQMLAAYFAVEKAELRTRVYDALDGAIKTIAGKRVLTSVSEAELGAVIHSALASLRKASEDTPLSTPETKTNLDTLLKACDVDGGLWKRLFTLGWAPSQMRNLSSGTLGASQKISLGNFVMMLNILDNSTKERINLTSLKDLVDEKAAFGRNKAKRREERNERAADRESRCQFLVPCGSHDGVGKLCECLEAVSVASAVEGVPLCSKHSKGGTKKEEMAAFLASMNLLRRNAAGVNVAERAITGAIDEIRAAAVWGQGTASVEYAMSTMDDIDPKFGAAQLLTSAQALVSRGVSVYRSSGAPVPQAQADTAKWAGRISASEQRLQSDAGSSSSTDLALRPVERSGDRAPTFVRRLDRDGGEGDTVATSRGQSVPRGISNEYRSSAGPNLELVLSDARRAPTENERLLFANLYSQFLTYQAQNKAENQAQNKAETQMVVFDPSIARKLEAENAKRRELARKLDGEMSSRGSKGSVMRLLGHNTTSDTKGSGDRNDTALSIAAMRNLAIGLVSRRANKIGAGHTTDTNDILTGLKNIGILDRTIAAIEEGKNMADPDVCYLSSTAVYEVLSWCVKLTDSDSESGTSGTSGRSGSSASGMGLDAVLAENRGHSCIVIHAIDDFRSALDAVEANDQDAFHRAVKDLIPVFSQAHELGAHSNPRESASRARVIGRALKMLSTCAILHGPAEDPPDSIEAVVASIYDVRACVAVEDQRNEWEKMFSSSIKLDIKGMITSMFTGLTGPSAAQQSEFGMMKGIDSLASGAANFASGIYNAGSSALDSGTGIASAVKELSDVSDAVKACAKAIEEKLMFLIELFFGMFSLLATGTLSVNARTAISRLKLSRLSTQEQEDLLLGAKDLEREKLKETNDASEFGGQKVQDNRVEEGKEVRAPAPGGASSSPEPRHVDSFSVRAAATASDFFGSIWNLILGLLTWVVEKFRKWNQNNDGSQRGSIVDVFGDITTGVIKKLGEWTTDLAQRAPDGKAKTLGKMFGLRGPLAVDLLKRCRNWWSSKGGIMAILKNPADLAGMSTNHVAAVNKYARVVKIALAALLAARLLQIMAVFGPRSGSDGPMSSLWNEMKTQMTGLMKGGG